MSDKIPTNHMQLLSIWTHAAATKELNFKVYLILIS